MITYAIIPARGGSKGVPGKNIKVLGGHPLIAYSIAAAKQAKNISRIIVSTDSPEIAEAARAYGAELPFMRPPELALDTSTDYKVMNHAITWFGGSEGRKPDLIAHLRPTTPLRDPAVIDAAVAAMESDQASTALRSAHAAPESPFKWFKRTAEGRFLPLMEGLTPDEINQPRQQFAPAYIPDGYIDIIRVSHVSRAGNLHGNAMKAFISPKCVEVDTAEDLELLEFELARGPNPLRAYLDSYAKNH